MKHPARVAALAVALVVIVFGVVLALNVGSDPQEDAQQSHLIGKAAPAFDLPNLAAQWMIGIVRQDETGDVKAYVKKNGIEWKVALDPGSIAALDFGTRGQPETYAISPSGVVAAAKFGPMSSRELELFLAAARQTA